VASLFPAPAANSSKSYNLFFNCWLSRSRRDSHFILPPKNLLPPGR
jgi:hypothetical protein